LSSISYKEKGKEKAHESESDESLPDPRDLDINYSVSYSSDKKMVIASSSKTIIPPFFESNYGKRLKHI